MISKISLILLATILCSANSFSTSLYSGNNNSSNSLDNQYIEEDNDDEYSSDDSFDGGYGKHRNYDNERSDNSSYSMMDRGYIPARSHSAQITNREDLKDIDDNEDNNKFYHRMPSKSMMDIKTREKSSPRRSISSPSKTTIKDYQDMKSQREKMDESSSRDSLLMSSDDSLNQDNVKNNDKNTLNNNPQENQSIDEYNHDNNQDITISKKNNPISKKYEKNPGVKNNLESELQNLIQEIRDMRASIRDMSISSKVVDPKNTTKNEKSKEKDVNDPNWRILSGARDSLMNSCKDIPIVSPYIIHLYNIKSSIKNMMNKVKYLKESIENFRSAEDLEKSLKDLNDKISVIDKNIIKVRALFQIIHSFVGTQNSLLNDLSKYPQSIPLNNEQMNSVLFDLSSFTQALADEDIVNEIKDFVGIALRKIPTYEGKKPIPSYVAYCIISNLLEKFSSVRDILDPSIKDFSRSFESCDKSIQKVIEDVDQKTKSDSISKDSEQLLEGIESEMSSYRDTLNKQNKSLQDWLKNVGSIVENVHSALKDVDAIKKDTSIFDKISDKKPEKVS